MFSDRWPIQARFWPRSLGLLGISARVSFLACPEQLSNAKLSNGPRNRLNLSGTVQNWTEKFSHRQNVSSN
jgi:hypothetical protein